MELTLEETNKARVAMGLTSLAEKGAEVDAGPSQDEIAERNYDELQARLRAEREAAETKKRVDSLLNQRQLNAKKAGKGLGDASTDGDNAKAWAKSFKASAKKRAAELAAQRRQQEQDEADAVAANVYDERHLKGLRVGHDVDSFEEGGEHILTLKDSRVADDEDDELVNVNLAEYERTKERNELLKQGKAGRAYTGYDDEGSGKSKGILAKYDEEEDRQAAKEAAGFTLGDDDLIQATAASSKLKEDTSKTVDRALLSLDYTKNLEVNDYAQEGEAGFKKSKKSKSKKKRAGQQRTALADDEGDMVIDQPVTTSREELEEQAMRDDEELQLSLARARREKSRKGRQERPTYNEDLAVKEEDAEETTGGLVLDDTTEFIRNISSQSTLAQLEQKPRPSSVKPSTTGLESLMAVDEEEKPHVEMEVHETEALLQPKMEDEYENGPVDEDKMEDERLVGSSLSATLSILNQQGLLHKMTPEEREKELKSKEHAAWIASRRGDQKAREDARLAAKAAGDSISQEQREAENRARDAEYNRRQMEAMANYKPNVNISYTDEFGREMNHKEAWKMLNHQFHGHGSGAAKTEARLRKIAEEKKKEAMASGDTPGGLNSAFQARQERTGSATMVLSVGNRGSAPMIEGDLAPSLHANPAGASSSKGKGKGREEVNLTPMLTFAPTQIHHERASGQASVMTPISIAAAANPAPRQSAGFSRVTSKAVERAESPAPAAASTTAAPIKISIGKRKAEGEGEGSPASKRKA